MRAKVEALKLIRKQPGITIRSLATTRDTSYGSARNTVLSLVKDGMIQLHPGIKTGQRGRIADAIYPTLAGRIICDRLA